MSAEPQAPPAGDADGLLARAARVLPGAATLQAATLPAGEGFVAERGSGAYLHTTDGRRLTDFVLGGGPLVLGHAPSAILAAIASSSALGTQHFVVHRRTVELAERICEHVPSAQAVRFCGSGSEATFHALRLARAATGRSGILKFDGGYHGHHDLATWSFESGRAGDPPVAESAGIQRGVERDVAVVPFNDATAARAALSAQPQRFAAVIVEPFQRALEPQPGFLESLREACDSVGAVLIFDEVVTGFRFAPGGAQARYGVTPDLTTLGKALAGGLPLAALAGRRELMEHLSPASPEAQRSYHCGTFNGYLLGVECAHATLDEMLARDGAAVLERRSQQVADGLRRAFADACVPVWVSAAGGLFQPYFSAVPVIDAAGVRASDLAAQAEYHRLLLEAGVYKLAPKGYVSLAHGDDEIEQLLEATRWALRAQVLR